MKLIIATLLAGLTQAENLFHQRGYSSMNDYLELMELEALEALAFDMQEDYEIDTYDLEELQFMGPDQKFTQWLRDSYKRTYQNVLVTRQPQRYHCPLEPTPKAVETGSNNGKAFTVMASNGPFECCLQSHGEFSFHSAGGFNTWAFTGNYKVHGHCIRFESPPKQITKINGDWELIQSGSDITYSLQNSVTNTDGSSVSTGTTKGYSVAMGIAVTVGGELYGGSVTSSLTTTSSESNSIVRDTSKQLSNSTGTTCSATCGGSNHKNQRLYQWYTRASKSDGGYFKVRTCHYRCLDYGVSTNTLKTPYGG